MIITKEQAIVKGSNRYYDGTPCGRGHITEKYVRDSYCCECKKISEIRNAERRKAQFQERYNRSPDKYIKRSKTYTLLNADAVAVRQRRWREENKDKIAQYRKDNAGLYAFHAANRRKKIKRATPPWADMEAIKEFYLEAQRLTNVTGIPHEVDHIIPITNDMVCGLHCEINLQILTKEENLKKSNKFYSM